MVTRRGPGRRSLRRHIPIRTAVTRRRRSDSELTSSLPRPLDRRLRPQERTAKAAKPTGRLRRSAAHRDERRTQPRAVRQMRFQTAQSQGHRDFWLRPSASWRCARRSNSALGETIKVTPRRSVLGHVANRLTLRLGGLGGFLPHGAARRETEQRRTRPWRVVTCHCVARREDGVGRRRLGRSATRRLTIKKRKRYSPSYSQRASQVSWTITRVSSGKLGLMRCHSQCARISLVGFSRPGTSFK